MQPPPNGEAGEETPEVPFDQRGGRGPIGRFASTLLAGLTPLGGPRLSEPGPMRSALLFAFWTFVPVAALRGVIPYTHHIAFAPPFRVELLGAPDRAALLADVLRAMGLSMGESVLSLFALGICWRSLVGGYAEREGAKRAATRGLLYRAWLLPMGFWGPAAGIFVWAFSLDSTFALLSFEALQAVFPVLLFIGLRRDAERSLEVGPIASWVVTVLPFVLLLLVGGLLQRGLLPFLPTPAGAGG